MNTNAYTRQTLLVAVLLGALVWTDAHAAKRIPVVPTNGTSVKVAVAGAKAKTYFLLSKSTPLQIEVDGPGRLTGVSRLNLSKSNTGSERYTIKILENRKQVLGHASQTEKSKAVITKGNIPLGKIRKTSLKVPDGSHKYQIFLEGTSADEAVVKFRFLPAKAHRSLVSVEALSYNRVVTALVKEKVRTYYVSTPAQKVQLRVIGPTRLRVTTRLNYDAKMKGGQRYTISVWEGEKRVALKPLITTKAVGMMYREWKEVTPGKVRSFFLDVPGGEHRYRFSLDETIGTSVSLRFFIPQGDLDNEE